MLTLLQEEVFTEHSSIPAIVKASLKRPENELERLTMKAERKEEELQIEEKA